METGNIRRITGLSIATAVLYNIGILSPFFAVPLQYSTGRSRKGFFLITSLISMILILSFRAMILSPVKAVGFVYIDALILFLAIAGLYVCNFMLKGFSLPVRTAVVTAGVAVLSLFLLPLMQGARSQMIQSLDSLLSLGSGLKIPESSGQAGGVMNGETLFVILQDLAGSTGFAWYFYFIVFTRWMGNLMIKKVPDSEKAEESDEWQLPDGWIWFLFLPLTLFLLNKLLSAKGVHFLGVIPYYAVTNATLISAGAYALRGLMKVRRFLIKKGIPRQRRILFLLTAGFLMVIPGFNLVIFILCAGLGVSELWINYRL